MTPLTFEEVVAAIAARTNGPPAAFSVQSVGTDSRGVRPGELFFAIRGDRFDGHAYVADALQAGAAGAVVSDRAALPESIRDSDRLAYVPDVVAALGRLARYYRHQIPAVVVAVSGSNGKTTTKFMIDCVLGSRRRGRAGVKSFNNSIGVPLTLLSAEASDEYVVAEIGTNKLGEVAALADIVQPDVAVVVSVGEEHLEFLEDLSRIADEELSVMRSVRPGGMAAVHADLAERAAAVGDPRLTRVSFGAGPGADLRACDVKMDASGLQFRVNGRFDYRIPVLGAHNAVNALAAIAVGRRFGMEHDQIAAALKSFRPPPMRLEAQTAGRMTILNDAYNANPASMNAALATLDAWSGGGRKVAVLGDMRELGRHAERCHAAVGRVAGRSSAALIAAVGRHAAAVRDAALAASAGHKQVLAYPTIEQAAADLPARLGADDVILLKGSRSMGMERLLTALTPTPTTPAESAAPPAAARPATENAPGPAVTPDPSGEPVPAVTGAMTSGQPAARRRRGPARAPSRSDAAAATVAAGASASKKPGAKRRSGTSRPT